MQGLWRLGPTKRASPATVQEAWAVKAGYDEDGAGGHGILGRSA